jgi:predicted MFS family arabinose efflux permease
MEKTLFRQKRIVIFGIVNILVALGLGRFLFSMSVPLIHAYYQISFTRIGILASLILFGYLSFSYLGGVALHRYSRKAVSAIALSLLTGAFLILFLSSEYLLLCIGSFLMGSASGTIYMSIFPVINEFVPENKYGSYMGLIFAGAGLGIFLVAGAVRIFLNSRDAIHLIWGISAIISFIVALINITFFEDSPSLIDMGNRRETVKYYKNAWKLLYHDQLLRNITVAYFFYGMSYSSYLNYIFAYIAEVSAPAPVSGLWFIFGLASILSSIIWGRLYDGAAFNKVIFTNYFFTALAIFFSVASSRLLPLVVSVSLFGLCFFGYITIVGGIIVKATRHLSSVYMGKLTLIHTVGQVLGALGGGISRDRTGSFTGVFVFSLITLLFSMGLFLVVSKASLVRRSSI